MRPYRSNSGLGMRPYTVRSKRDLGTKTISQLKVQCFALLYEFELLLLHIICTCNSFVIVQIPLFLSIAMMLRAYLSLFNLCINLCTVH